MKRRLTLGLALPLTVGMMAVAGAMHSPSNHTFAAASTPPPLPTFMPTSIGQPPGPPSPTPTETPIPTNTPVPTDTATAAPTATTPPVAAASPTPTPKPKKTATAVPTATTAPTQPSAPGPAATIPPAPTPPATGGGGTYVYSSGSALRLGAAAARSGQNKAGVASSQAAPNTQAGTGSLATLPRTGGGAGGTNPTSPLAPLALLGAIAIVAGRMLPRLLKR